MLFSFIKKSTILPIRYCFGSIETFSSQQLKKSQKYVEETLRNRTWVTYMMASYIPAQLRSAFYAINLFQMQLIKIVQNSRQPALGLGKLDFWKQSLSKIYKGQKPQPQPISICLHNAVHNNPLTYGYFLRIINVRATQISKRSINTMNDMCKMSDDSKSTMIALCLQLLRIQIKNQHMMDVISYLGQAIGICQYLKRVPYSLRNNRFLLPQQILTKYNLTTKNIWDRVYGKPSQQLFDGVLQIASYAKKYFELAVKIFQQNPQSFPQHSFRAFLRGVQTQYYLQNLQKYNFNLFDPNLNNYSPLKLPYRTYNAAKSKKFWVGMDIKK